MTARELADKICRTLHEAGHQAYLVGGCVRDLELGREPEDYDVTTDAHPPRVQELFPESLAIGAQFGVILVVEDGEEVQVATFRSDIGYSDGRHPDRVIFSSSAREDVTRRDFTINGLLLDPLSGKVFDYVGGRADIRAMLIRAIGDLEQRFREDKLRMVRAVRFSARFGFEIEPATLAAITKLAAEIHAVSAERLRDELTKILTEGAARRGFDLLDETGLLREILPELSRMKGVEQPPQFHPEGDVWIHTRMMLGMLHAGTSPALAWGALLHDVGKPPTFAPATGPGTRIRFDGHVEVGARIAEEIMRRLRFPNDEIEQVVALVANHLRFKDVAQMRPATLKRFVRLPHFDEHLELHRIDCLCSHGQLDSYDFVRRFLEETPPEEVRPARLVSGDDLKALGLQPGPAFKEILQNLEDAQLEGRIRNRDEALELVRTEYLKR